MKKDYQLKKYVGPYGWLTKENCQMKSYIMARNTFNNRKGRSGKFPL